MIRYRHAQKFTSADHRNSTCLTQPMPSYV